MFSENKLFLFLKSSNGESHPTITFRLLTKHDFNACNFYCDNIFKFGLKIKKYLLKNF